jgi:hypothetical protein
VWDAGEFGTDGSVWLWRDEWSSGIMKASWNAMVDLFTALESRLPNVQESLVVNQGETASS